MMYLSFVFWFGHQRLFLAATYSAAHHLVTNFVSCGAEQLAYSGFCIELKLRAKPSVELREAEVIILCGFVPTSDLLSHST